MKELRKVKWPIVVRSKRLELRPYKIQDYQAWIDAYTKRKPKQHKYDGGPHDPKETPKKWFRKLIAKHSRLAKNDKVYVFGIFDRVSRRHLGTIDIATICRDWYQWANLGYVIHNTEQGNGYGKEAARIGIAIAFTKLGYKRIEASINLDNRRSIYLAKVIGMKRESIRKEYIYENKQWIDHVIYVALNPAKQKKIYFML